MGLSACSDSALEPEDSSTSGTEGSNETLRERSGFDVDLESEIGKKWLQLGAAATVGNPTSFSQGLPGGIGRYQTFDNGVIVESRSHLGVYLSHEIFWKWRTLQGQTNQFGQDLFTFVGVPRQDFETQGSHQLGHFERGKIVVRPGVGEYVTYGKIGAQWLAHGSELGLPTGDETDLSQGRVQDFEHGAIYWKAGDLHATVLTGPIHAAWLAAGATTGDLGFPIGSVDELVDDQGSPIGEYCEFEEGNMYHRPGHPVVTMPAELRGEYAKHGGPLGWLGFPVASAETAGSGDIHQDLEHGLLVDHKANDAYRGTLALGEFDFHFTRFLGHGTDFFRDLDPFLFLEVDTAHVEVVDARYPSSGAYDDQNNVEFNLQWPIGQAHGDLELDVHVVAYEDDPEAIIDDKFGEVSVTYSIENLWGLAGTNKYSDSHPPDGLSFDVWMRVSNSIPIDESLPYKQSRFWSFDNFGTDELSYDQFAQTFVDVDADETLWINPLNRLFYETLYDSLAEQGNCFGMSLEALYASEGRSSYTQPLMQYFPNTQDGSEPDPNDPAHAAVINEINIKHGYQLGKLNALWSAYKLLSGTMRRPVENFEFGRSLWQHGFKPLMVLTGDKFANAHSVLPYDFTGPEACDDGEVDACYHISILDSNHPFGEDPNPDRVEIHIADDTFAYGSTYQGSNGEGGRMFFQPYALFANDQYTPYAVDHTAYEDLIFFLHDEYLRVAQVSDAQGRTLFRPGLSGLPTDWDDLEPEGPGRLPGFGPLLLPDTAAEVQAYAGTARGTDHRYALAPAPGTPIGTRMQAVVHTSGLSAHVELPATSSEPDLLEIREIGTDAHSVELNMAAGTTSRDVALTLAGADKHRWVELSQMPLAPEQSLGLRLDQGGYRVDYDNDGPETTAMVRVRGHRGADIRDLGPVTIRRGSGHLEFRNPTSELTRSGEVWGKNSWLIAPVTVTLTAADYSGQGIDRIETSPDGQNWTDYAGPFSYVHEGATLLHHRARDLAFNVEQPKQASFRIDTRSPSATATVDTQAGVELSFQASDPTPGSGVAGLHVRYTGSSGPVVNFVPGDAGSVDLPTQCSELEYWAEDIAGHLQQPKGVVPDSVAPVFESVPDNLTVTHCVGLDIGMATASDDCGSVQVFNDAPAKFPIGTTVVTWTAEDAAGNQATATQRVTALLGDDPSCCPDGTNIILGSAAPDVLNGTPASDCILGRGGSDVVNAGSGDDYVSGGAGNDVLTLDSGADFAWGGAGIDTIMGSGGSDYIDGGADVDICNGGGGSDALTSCDVPAGCTAACCALDDCAL